MRLLVDTHTFLWALMHDPRLSPRSRQILTSDEHEIYFSLVSLWEFSIKIKTGKLNALGSSVAYLRAEMENYSMQLVPIRYEHILALETFPAHHSDPFDRLLIAQAVTEALPILTHDEKFKAYPVKVLW